MDIKNLNADSKLVDFYLKDELEEFELRNKILSNIDTPFYGVNISIVPDDNIVDRSMLAKSCNELNNVKDSKASFVIGFIDRKTIGISGRSNGDVNIQIIMEKLGGGGHYSSGACQLDCESLQEAKEKLIDAIDSTYKFE